MYKQLLHINATIISIFIIGLYTGMVDAHGNVSLLRADYHPDGVIGGKTNLDQGNYTVFITGESVPPVHYQYPLRVQ
jgi:hypothetical protein